MVEMENASIVRNESKETINLMKDVIQRIEDCTKRYKKIVQSKKSDLRETFNEWCT
jgi:hypothetical protein